MDRANLPGRYRGATVGAIQHQELRDWVQGAIDNPVSWLGEGLGFLMSGQLNAGKSSIAAILLMDALQRCEVGLWLAARQVPGVMFREGERNQELNDRLYDADVVVIDDLGAEAYSMRRAGGSALEGAMRAVYDNGRSLIVTSNLSSLKDRYPEPMMSVLQRMTGRLVVKNTQWDDGPGDVTI